jgi:hypothetical protein
MSNKPSALLHADAYPSLDSGPSTRAGRSARTLDRHTKCQTFVWLRVDRGERVDAKSQATHGVALAHYAFADPQRIGAGYWRKGR